MCLDKVKSEEQITTDPFMFIVFPWQNTIMQNLVHNINNNNGRFLGSYYGMGKSMMTLKQMSHQVDAMIQAVGIPQRQIYGKAPQMIIVDEIHHDGSTASELTRRLEHFKDSRKP